ncbi:hypothetical protein P280DRAFT_481375 [Massarina eburnea CBS 473.64]|uniref:Uncharacterized protein n=1 Tax=Massarina eburnea CBS 473.64 TaxID=1395130 RepID=A0A6A6RVM4_9PLEO|nr:hypothetical protein P280DRAFT_481375 [Massarina eburnea CBS 473.64]
MNTTTSTVHTAPLLASGTLTIRGFSFEDMEPGARPVTFVATAPSSPTTSRVPSDRTRLDASNPRAVFTHWRPLSDGSMAYSTVDQMTPVTARSNAFEFFPPVERFPRRRSTLGLVSHICTPDEYVVTYTPGEEFIMTVKKQKSRTRKWIGRKMKKAKNLFERK